MNVKMKKVKEKNRVGKQCTLNQLELMGVTGVLKT